MEERDGEIPVPGETIRLAHGTPGRDLYVVILVEEERAYCAPIHGDLRLWIPLSQIAEVKR